MGQHQRQPWFGCACCPSNIARFIPSLPGYVYAVKGNDVYVNLFMSNTANLDVNGRSVTLSQQTNYPWNGDIDITVGKNKAGAFALKVRIPGWVKNDVVPSDLYNYSDGRRLGCTVKVNGVAADGSLTPDGYYTIDRKWKKGDKVEVHFDMEPRTVKANDQVEADLGRIAIERGPLVYCAEFPDNDFEVLSVFINQKPQFEVKWRPDVLTGLTTLSTDAQVLSYDDRGRLAAKDVRLNMIPYYYAWNHCGRGQMAVWIPQELSASRPSMPPTLASLSRVTSSHDPT